MPANQPAYCIRNLWSAAAMLFVFGITAVPGEAVEPFSASGLIIPPTKWTPEQTPVDFLDMVGLQTKARWRQLYREPPPTPSTDRLRTAFTLGSLIGDGFLVLQATDMQQARNTNQDILSYCRVLGLGEKVSPRLMAMSTLASMGNWGVLRQDAVDGHMELTRLLREQRDDDLAILVDIGAWMRVIEISSSLVAAAPDVPVRPLCIGSVDLLKSLRQRFSQLSKPAQNHESFLVLGDMLDFLIRTWESPSNNPPSAEFVSKTNDKLKGLMHKLTLKKR